MQNILLSTALTIGIELKDECINQIALFFEFMNIWKTLDCTVSSNFQEREVRIWKILLKLHYKEKHINQDIFTN